MRKFFSGYRRHRRLISQQPFIFRVLDSLETVVLYCLISFAFGSCVHHPSPAPDAWKSEPRDDSYYGRRAD